MTQIRLLPVVVVAASALLVLKTVGLVTGGGYAVAPAMAAGAPAATQASQEAPETEDAPAPLTPEQMLEALPGAAGAGDIILNDLTGGGAAPGAGETGALVLERLAERRAELEAFAAELETRLALVEAAEMRIEERMAELNAIEAQINSTLDGQDAQESEHFAGLVAMYENMRPADAAAIFNDLDTEVLVRVGRQMNPRRLGPIMAKMTPQRAQSLTVLLAQADGGAPAVATASDFSDLPQIVGQ